MYDDGFISYPRTETNQYSSKTNFQWILDKLKSISEYERFIDSNEFSPPRKGRNNDEAHPPIHPVKPFEGDRNSKLFKIYDLIARRFMANCSKDAITQEVHVKVQVKDEFFHTKGTIIKEENFLAIYKKFYKVAEK